jgi:hypothetical protein
MKKINKKLSKNNDQWDEVKKLLEYEMDKILSKNIRIN